eukprot:TRINITY_DN4130_c0_g1_i2.p1 TRINITY_DN4130_c0_g1~~TRINITY_DN4130_c0_g1_i2.p1  ORF type:complete len:318 (+),score=82.27 TRINITY_DN4130_c0_g1_i2:19-972(+)
MDDPTHYDEIDQPIQPNSRFVFLLDTSLYSLIIVIITLFYLSLQIAAYLKLSVDWFFYAVAAVLAIFLIERLFILYILWFRPFLNRLGEVIDFFVVIICIISVILDRIFSDVQLEPGSVSHKLVYAIGIFQALSLLMVCRLWRAMSVYSFILSRFKTPAPEVLPVMRKEGDSTNLSEIKTIQEGDAEYYHEKISALSQEIEYYKQRLEIDRSDPYRTLQELDPELKSVNEYLIGKEEELCVRERGENFNPNQEIEVDLELVEEVEEKERLEKWEKELEQKFDEAEKRLDLLKKEEEILSVQLSKLLLEIDREKSALS